MYPAPPAGWYPDPDGSPRWRYWDGSAWTTHVAASDPPTPGASATHVAASDPPTAAAPSRHRSKLFNKRVFAGVLLFDIFVGELGVGLFTGLYLTPAGLVIAFVLYWTLFLLFDAIVTRYRLVNYQVTALTFTVYSVIVTGYLHHEIADYVVKPHAAVITTLIRIQSALFPAFAFQLLNRWQPRDPSRVLSVRAALAIFVGFVVLATPSRKFGLITLVDTFRDAPGPSIIFAVLGTLTFWLAFARRHEPTEAQGRAQRVVLWSCLVLGVIPSLWTFIALAFFQPIAYLVLSRHRWFRHLGM